MVLIYMFFFRQALQLSVSYSTPINAFFKDLMTRQHIIILCASLQLMQENTEGEKIFLGPQYVTTL